MLTIKGRIILIWRKLVKFILNINIDDLTGVFVSLILFMYCPPFKALVLGILGYLVYVRIEKTLIRIHRGKA